MGEGKRFAKILIATDGSKHSERAVRVGLELASCLGSKVLAIYVIDRSFRLDFPVETVGYKKDVYEKLSGEGKDALRYAKKEGEKMGIKVKTEIHDGLPSTEIIERAEDFDLVVMGTLGRTGIKRVLLGSVAQEVIKRAPCPVMVVRGKQD